MVEIGSVEISTVPNRPFGHGWPKFFRLHQRGSKVLVKCFLMSTEPFWGYGGLLELETAEIQKCDFAEISAPRKLTFFGRGSQNIFGLQPSRKFCGGT